jgi:hypothetical protein
MSHVKKNLFLFTLSFAILLCLTGISAAKLRPLTESDMAITNGQYGNPAIKLYIPINDVYNASKSGNMYGFAISGDVNVKRDNCIINDTLYGKGGTFTSSTLNTIPSERSYEIIFEYGINPEASFEVIIDRSTTENSFVPPAIWVTVNDGSKDSYNDSNVIQVQLSGGNGSLRIVSSQGVLGAGSQPANQGNHIFTFKIASDTGGGEIKPEDVSRIEIEGTPKTTYFEGDTFQVYGMTVWAYPKEDGGERVQLSENDYVCYAGVREDWENGGIGGFENSVFSLGDDVVMVCFGEHSADLPVTVLPVADISDMDISNGQMLGEWVYKKTGAKTWEINKKTNSYDAVVWYGETSGKFSFSASSAAKVTSGGKEVTLDDKGLYQLDIDLPDGKNWAAKTVIVTAGDSQPKTYTFTCYRQRFDGMPINVKEYFPIASQYTNGSTEWGGYGLDPVRTLLGWELDAEVESSTEGGIVAGPASLGSFGGYVVYEFKEPIADSDNNPYGVDFIVCGNSVMPHHGYSEPGNVLVSETGEDGTWYTLAGSAHYDDVTTWNYSLTYENKTGRAVITSDGIESGSYAYPDPIYYPLFPWTEDLKKKITLTGVALNTIGFDQYGKTAALPDFGYADTGKKATSNKADNPYKGPEYFMGHNQLTSTNGFDLKWAVDENGQPVDLSGKEIRFVKIQTAVFIDGGGTGDKSTEINGVLKAEPATTAVGKTQPPSQIIVDGVPVVFQQGVNEYSNVKVNPGAFVVNVAASKESNIYINGSRGASRTFEKMPQHEMLRIIVQEGQKEPAIVYINLEVDQTKEATAATKVTFDTDGGDPIGDLYLTKDSPEEEWEFPDPVKTAYATEGMTEFDEPDVKFYTFLGWFDSSGKKYTGEFSEKDDILKHETLSLTARWESFSETTIDTEALADGLTGVAYKATLSAVGGKSPYTWGKESGALPDGLSLSESGVISGTPTKAGKFDFKVSATDATNDRAEAPLRITVTNADVPGKPKSLDAEPGDGKVAISWGAPTSDGGSAITKYEVKSGNDEPWVTVSGRSHVFSGLINGTLYTFSVRAVNIKGAGEAATVTGTPAAAIIEEDDEKEDEEEKAETTNGGDDEEKDVDEEEETAEQPESSVSETPDFTPIDVDVEIGTGTNEVTSDMLAGLPELTENDIVEVIDGRVVSNVKTAVAGLSKEDAAAIETDSETYPMIPLPPQEKQVSEEGKTAVLTFKEKLPGFAGHKLGDLAILKLMKTEGGSATVPLEHSKSLPEIGDGLYVWTDNAGTPYGDSTVIDKSAYYYLNVAVRDEGPYDFKAGQGKKVLDPLTIALKKGAVKVEKEDDEDGGDTALPGGGGCDAGALTLAALAAAGFVIAARRRKAA